MSAKAIAVGCTFVVALLAVGGTSADEAWFSGIGHLPGGRFESCAYGVSGDGSTGCAT
jgi:hypothetical protein